MSYPLSSRPSSYGFEVVNAGPYFVAEDAVVYLDQGWLQLTSTDPGALPVDIFDDREEPIAAITQDDEGRVYVLRGGGFCDLLYPIPGIDVLERGPGGDWGLRPVFEAEPDVFESDPTPTRFAAAPDGSFWIGAGDQVYVVSASGRVDFKGGFGVDHDEGISAIAPLDSNRAIVHGSWRTFLSVALPRLRLRPFCLTKPISHPAMRLRLLLPALFFLPAAAPAVYAQLSVPLHVFKPFGGVEPGPQQGVLAVDDTTLVYLYDGSVRVRDTRPDRAGPEVTGERASATAIAPARDGRVYLYDGGVSCGIPFGGGGILRVLARDGAGAWTVTQLSDPSRAGAPYLPHQGALDVAPDGTIWLVGGETVFRFNDEGDVRADTLALELVGSEGREAPGVLVALDSETAFVSFPRVAAAVPFHNDGATVYRIDLGADPAARATALEGVRAVDLVGDDGEVLALSGEAVVRLSAAGEVLSSTPLPFEPYATPLFSSPQEVVGIEYLVDSGSTRLYRFDVEAAEATHEPYYDFERMQWVITSAAVTPDGGLALTGGKYLGPLADLFKPVQPINTFFLQHAPAGTPAALYAPDVDFAVALDVRDGDNGPELTQRITVTNQSDEVISVARVTGSDGYGDPCDGNFNAATATEIPPGATVAADNEVDRYRSDDRLREGDVVQNYFVVAHVDGRPTRRDYVNVEQVVTGIGEVVDDPSLRLYPTVAEDEVRLSWSGEREGVLILDALGRVALRQNLRRDVREARVDVRVLPKGHYFLAVRGAQGTAVRAFQVVD